MQKKTPGYRFENMHIPINIQVYYFSVKFFCIYFKSMYLRADHSFSAIPASALPSHPHDPGNL